MNPIDRHLWLGLLSPPERTGIVAGFGGRGRSKRSGWVVVTFFVLILMAWLDSQS